MRISDAGVEFATRYQRQESLNIRERLEVSRVAPPPREAVSLSDEAKAMEAADSIRKAAEEAAKDPRLALLAALLARLTGRQLVLRPACGEWGKKPAAEAPPAPAPAPQQPLRLAVAYALDAEYRLAESVGFQVEARVRTADGQEIAVRVAFELSRETVERLNLRVGFGRQPPTKDPLVLNFAGTSAELSEGRFAFDLNADGTPEAIPFLASGSAFLAIDRNGDGIVNDGRELFGPTTGDGFQELAALDADGNGFIDEADPAFSRLLLFNPHWSIEGTGRPNDQSGFDRTAAGDWTVPLARAGVGALYVGRVATPFDLGAGLLRASSFYLTTAGGAGTLQQVDLKV